MGGVKSTLHIACGLDSKYTRFAGVLLVSLFENNKDEHFCCHLMALRLTADDKEDLREIASRYGHELRFYDMSEEMFRDFHTTEQWNVATYFRLVLPQLLDEAVERVIYLDCDIVCRGPVGELFRLDMQGNIVAACEDHVISPRMSLCWQNGVEAPNFYFNAGVLLIDCKAWREKQVTDKCLQYLKAKHPMHLDQDTLNYVLQGRWLHLPYRWNFMADFHGMYFSDKDFQMDMKRSYPFYPVLIHFTGVKPWHHANRSVYKVDFYRYQSLTKWRNCIPKNTMKERLTNMARMTCHHLGIKRTSPFKLYGFTFAKGEQR